MRIFCDEVFLAGQAFMGMPFGINADFDAWRKQPIRPSENIVMLRAFDKQKPINFSPPRRHRLGRLMAQGCH